MWLHIKRILITNGCQGCLEHPCIEVCPKKAISTTFSKSQKPNCNSNCKLNCSGCK